MFFLSYLYVNMSTFGLIDLYAIFGNSVYTLYVNAPNFLMLTLFPD